MKNDEIMVQGTIMKKRTLMLIWSIVFSIVALLSYLLVTSKGQWFTWLMGFFAILCWFGYYGYGNYQKAKNKR